MTSKRKSSKKPNSKELQDSSNSDEDQAVSITRMVLRLTVQAVVAIADYDKAHGNLDSMVLVDALGEQTSAVDKGDLKRAETMLTAQAHTLDATFNNLAWRAIRAEYMDNLDHYLKLALRAQSQCWAAWKALATIKGSHAEGSYDPPPVSCLPLRHDVHRL